MASAAVRPAVAPPRCRSLAVPKVAVSLRPNVDARASILCEAQNSERRQRVEARNKAYNKHYVDLIKSSSRAALKEYAAFMSRASELQQEAELQEADKLMFKAYSNIDKAVTKGVLHKNTGARRKSKIARARQRLLIAASLYTPEPKPALAG
jgi:small subunit ribosomal protein S20